MFRADPTKAFVALNAVAALGCFAVAIAHPVFNGYAEFFCYFCVVALTSTLKVTLPGIDGTLSVSFIFLFLGILEMTYAETLLLVVMFRRSAILLAFTETSETNSSHLQCLSIDGRNNGCLLLVQLAWIAYSSRTAAISARLRRHCLLFVEYVGDVDRYFFER